MSKIRLLQVGCGSISPAWLGVLSQRDDVEIVGLVDLNEQTAQAMREKYQWTCDVFKDYEAAMRLLKPDVVIDNTVPEAHFSVVTTALENGCHVLGEKPLADTMENAAKMVMKANQAQKSYFVMQNRRYLKNIRAYKNIIQSGCIGQLGFLSANFFLGPHFGGFRDVMESPLILDMAVHTFDQARFMSGSDPVSVYCQEFNPSGSWYKGDSSACCIFEMSNNMVFSYNGAWCAIGNQTSWEGEWRAMGSSGSAIWDGQNVPFYECAIQSEEKKFFTEVERKTPEWVWEHEEGHAGCIDEMLMALKEGRKAETDCNDNIKSFAMVMAAIKSSREGRKVYIDEVLK